MWYSVSNFSQFSGLLLMWSASSIVGNSVEQLHLESYCASVNISLTIKRRRNIYCPIIVNRLFIVKKCDLYLEYIWYYFLVTPILLLQIKNYFKCSSSLAKINSCQEPGPKTKSSISISYRMPKVNQCWGLGFDIWNSPSSNQKRCICWSEETETINQRYPLSVWSDFSYQMP